MYADGAAELVSDTEHLLVRPTFGLQHEGTYETIHVAPLLDAIAADHLVAVFLVRLGGYAIGVFEGEQLVASKVGSRFVKNRHKKGGSSSNRFRRRRDEQAKALVEEAAEVAASVLTPGASERSSPRSAATGVRSSWRSRRVRIWRGCASGRSRASWTCPNRATARSKRCPTTSTRSSSKRCQTPGVSDTDLARANGSRGIRHRNETHAKV